MSFDLYIWREQHPITAEHANTICQELAEGRDDAVEPDTRVLAFHQELTDQFPDLESLSDEELESSPWNMNPDATSSRVILCMGWSSADEVSQLILELADRHGLVCFDPQGGQIHNPTQALTAGGLRLEFCDGSQINDPSREDLRVHVQRLSAKNWYAVLERRPGWFVQVGIGPFAGNVPPGKFALEYCEGAPDRHYRVLVDNLDDVLALFEGFATGDEAWKTAYSWTKY